VSVGKWSILVLLALKLALGGCSTTPLPVSEPAPRSSAPYLVGPGDTLNVVVWRSPELSLTVPVRPDGKITTPLVEDLQASGKTASQLARDIEQVLARYIQSPVVTVIVTSFAGPYSQQVRVIGLPGKHDAAGCHDRSRRHYGFRRRKPGDHPAHRGRQDSPVRSATDESHQGRGSLGQRGDAPRRCPCHSAELFLAPGHEDCWGLRPQMRRAQRNRVCAS
jgi:hypothetical protein